MRHQARDCAKTLQDFKGKMSENPHLIQKML